MLRLSVNVNKIATLRNSRGGGVPSVLSAVGTIVDAGCRGITVHPRDDERHITRRDVDEIANYLSARNEQIEYNIEGDPRPQWLEMVRRVRPHQATLVPVRPGEITSQAGWNTQDPIEEMRDTIAELRALSIRVSVFIDPTLEAVEWAAKVGADRVELYTEPFAKSFARGKSAAESTAPYVEAAKLSKELGLGVNAGHDLDLKNLATFGTVPHVDEVSIGHALISQAVFDGLRNVVSSYLTLIDSINRRAHTTA